MSLLPTVAAANPSPAASVPAPGAMPTMESQPESLQILCDLVAQDWPSGFERWVRRVATQMNAALDPIARALVDRLAVAAWRQRRLLIEEQQPSGSVPGERARLQAHAQADRAFSRALADLIRYRQATRRTDLTARVATEQTTRSRPIRIAAAGTGGGKTRPTAAGATEPEPGSSGGPAPERQPSCSGAAETPGASCAPAPGADSISTLESSQPTEGACVELAELAERAPADWSSRFVIDPEVSAHWPVVRGTRRLAEEIASVLATGPRWEAVRSAYPELTAADLAAVAKLETQGRTGPWPPCLEPCEPGNGP